MDYKLTFFDNSNKFDNILRMLKIRLSRVGRKHEPVYRLVLVDSREPAITGKVGEVLGSYDSRRKDQSEFKNERVKYWISKGAQLSDTAHNLLVRKGVLSSPKRNVLPKRIIEKARAPKEIKEEAPVVEAVPVEALPTNEIVGTPTSEDQSVGAVEEVAPVEAPAEEPKKEDEEAPAVVE